MKQFFFICAVIFLASLVNVSAMATPFGNNITISDNSSKSDTGWYGIQEDNEVEPGMATGQGWDLEGFFLKGTTLTMVGGFNFITGNSGYESGDIFIDIGGDAAVYGGVGPQENGNGNSTVKKTFGYDYVLDLNFGNSTYDIYALNTDTWVETAFYSQNQGSSPWRYVSGGREIGLGLKFDYFKDMTDKEVHFLGGYHNAVSVSLDFLQLNHHGAAFISHFTMGCGNDNLMGQAKLPTPEPATLILFGCGLIGLAGLGRKKLAKR